MKIAENFYLGTQQTFFASHETFFISTFPLPHFALQVPRRSLQFTLLRLDLSSFLDLSFLGLDFFFDGPFNFLVSIKFFSLFICSDTSSGIFIS